MWEWRVFSRQDLQAILKPDVYGIIVNGPVESRVDDYFNYFHEDFGLKERGTAGQDNVPLLEIKARIDKVHWGAELWKKWEIPLKKTLKKQRSKEIQLILEYLENAKTSIYPYYLPKYENCAEIIKSKYMTHVEIFKQRRQITAFYTYQDARWEILPEINRSICQHPPYGILIEYTKLLIDDETWYTVTVEGKQLDMVYNFLNENLLVPLEEIRDEVLGYPEFLKLRMDRPIKDKSKEDWEELQDIY